MPTASGPLLLGLDLGGTKLSAVVGTPAGEVLHRQVTATLATDGRAAVIDRIVALLGSVLSHASERPVALGVSHGGPVDPTTGLCRSVNLPEWEDVPLGTILSDALGLPVEIDNDANAGALAEFMFGAGVGHRSIAYMTMGTGIGGGIVHEGRIFRGAYGMAGEIGHVTIVRDGRPCNCGRRGCLQAYASGPAIAAAGLDAAVANDDSELLGLRDSAGALSCEALCAAARRGNAVALGVIHEAAVCMGIGCASFIKVVDPELIAIGTLAVKAGDLLLDTINEVAYGEYHGLMPDRRPIVASGLGDDVGDMAALALAAQGARPAG